MLAGDFRLLQGYLAFLATVLAGNLAVDLLWPGSSKQFNWGASPLAHGVQLWNVLGMLLVGFSANLLGGCPFRQIIAAGQGSSDGAMAVLGMVAGAAFCHNFGLAAKPATENAAGGPSAAGMAAVAIGILVCIILGLYSRPRPEA